MVQSRLLHKRSDVLPLSNVEREPFGSVGVMETVVWRVTDPWIAEMASSPHNSASLQKKTVWFSRHSERLWGRCQYLTPDYLRRP